MLLTCKHNYCVLGIFTKLLGIKLLGLLISCVVVVDRFNIRPSGFAQAHFEVGRRYQIHVQTCPSNALNATTSAFNE